MLQRINWRAIIVGGSTVVIIGLAVYYQHGRSHFASPEVGPLMLLSLCALVIGLVPGGRRGSAGIAVAVAAGVLAGVVSGGFYASCVPKFDLGGSYGMLPLIIMFGGMFISQSIIATLIALGAGLLIAYLVASSRALTVPVARTIVILGVVLVLATPAISFAAFRAHGVHYVNRPCLP